MIYERISGKFILNKILLALEFETGFLLTLKEIFLRPSKAISAYIKGERKIYNPIKFLIICFTLTFFGNYLLDTFNKNNFGSGLSSPEFQNKIYLLVIIVIITVSSIFTLIKFKSYNFFENITVFSYTVGFFVFIMFISSSIETAILVIFKNISLESLSQISGFIIFPFMLIYLFLYFKRLDDTSILKSLGLLILFIVSFLISNLLFQFIEPFILHKSAARVGINFHVENDTINTKSVHSNYLVIDSIYNNSAAKEAGLIVGDEIHKINNEKTSAMLFNIQVERFEPGETILFEIKRNDRFLYKPILLKHKDSIKGFNF